MNYISHHQTQTGCPTVPCCIHFDTVASWPVLWSIEIYLSLTFSAPSGQLGCWQAECMHQQPHFTLHSYMFINEEAVCCHRDCSLSIKPIRALQCICQQNLTTKYSEVISSLSIDRHRHDSMSMLLKCIVCDRESHSAIYAWVYANAQIYLRAY